jgi:hypothetical protein
MLRNNFICTLLSGDATLLAQLLERGPVAGIIALDLVKVCDSVIRSAAAKKCSDPRLAVICDALPTLCEHYPLDKYAMRVAIQSAALTDIFLRFSNVPAHEYLGYAAQVPDLLQSLSGQFDIADPRIVMGYLDSCERPYTRAIKQLLQFVEVTDEIADRLRENGLYWTVCLSEDEQARILKTQDASTRSVLTRLFQGYNKLTHREFDLVLDSGCVDARAIPILARLCV